jgi:hypothetical protein
VPVAAQLVAARAGSGSCAAAIAKGSTARENGLESALPIRLCIDIIGSAVFLKRPGQLSHEKNDFFYVRIRPDLLA